MCLEKGLKVGEVGVGIKYDTHTIMKLPKINKFFCLLFN